MTPGGPPLSTPAPRRFLLSKRGPASSSQQQPQETATATATTITTPGPRQFQSPVGSSSQKFQTTPRFAPPPSSAFTPPAASQGPGFAFPGTQQRRRRQDPIRDDVIEPASSPLQQTQHLQSSVSKDSIEGGSPEPEPEPEAGLEPDEADIGHSRDNGGIGVDLDSDDSDVDFVGDSEGPTPKRRRVEISSADDTESETGEERDDRDEDEDEEMGSPTEDPADEEDEMVLLDVPPESPLSGKAEHEHEHEHDDIDIVPDVEKREQGATAQKTQPTFQAAPRFQVSEVEETYRGLPDAFSPQRRGVKYVPGGMAAEMQVWLAEVRGWTSEEHRPADVTVRFVVDDVRDGHRMYLVHGRRLRKLEGEDEEKEEGEEGSESPEEVPMKVILAGEGKLTGLSKRALVKPGSIVLISQPTWEVDLQGQGRWLTACDWALS